ncbi:serine O-acetyltransferase, partial [Vibrio lentus]
MKHCEQQKVWQCIVKEARQQSEQEPMLASFYHATIINHESLGAALSYILANKLKTASMPAMAVREVVEQAFKQDQSIIDAAACDICATVNRDPAVEMYSMPLLYLKGYHALQGYRVANWLWKQGRIALATYLQNQISVACQVDIHPAARIGKAIMLDHATGIVIGETAVVENDVSILQDVTLGGTGK